MQAQEASPKKRVAVLNFDNPGVSADTPSGLFGADGEDVGKGVSILLIEKLVRSGKYTVVDRSALEKLLKEQQDAANDQVDAYAMAARIGRALGLDAMIIGAVTRYGPEEARKNADGRSGMFSAGVRTRKSKAYVDLTARIFNVTTGAVEGGFTGSGESEKTGEITIVAARGKAAPSPEILGSEFAGSLLGEATRKAVDQLAAQLTSFAEQIPQSPLKIEGLVADVAGNVLTLNIGKKAGVRVGERLTILRDPPAPESANPPGMISLPQRVGLAAVTEVGEEFSTAIVSGGVEARVGDHVRDAEPPVPQPH
jgi:curli biogenesis system outer membrane secretion channel CsgG